MEATPLDSKQWLFLKQKRMRFNLHALSLADYHRASWIPRGLRIQKAPALYLDNEVFRRKWANILNKRSMDLMVLIIETSNQEIEKWDKEIADMEKQLRELLPLADIEYRKNLADTEKGLKSLEA